MFVVTYETVLFWWAMIQSIMTPPPSRSLLIGWLMLRFMSSTSSAEKQTQTFSLHSEKIQLFAWTDDITVVLRVHWLWWVSRQTPSVPAAILFDVTKPRLQTAEPTQSLQCVYFLLPTSCFLLPASFNARLMFLKGSCSGNIQHGRREEKKTSRLVSLMENHQCCSSPTLSASFSSQFQFLIFVSSDFYNICDNYNYCNVTTAEL